MAKPLSLADRIAQAKKENENKEDREIEKGLLTSLSSKQTVNQTVSQAIKQSDSQSDKQSVGQTDSLTVEHSDNLSANQSNRQSDRQSVLDWMSTQQKKIFDFLVSNDSRITRLKDIERATSVPYGTIRGSIKALVREKLISNPERYRKGMFQGFSYVVNESLKNKFEQLKPVDCLIDSLSDSLSLRQSDRQSNEHPSYKKERKMFLNNLSFYVEKSEFWKQQGLSLQKCQSWIDEFPFCDSGMLIQQLQYAEFMDKVTTADNPISYFYRTLKNGGFTRPAGFEFPEERAERLQKEELVTRREALASLEKIRVQEKELADKEAFYAFLADKESVTAAINDIEAQFTTPNFKISLKVYHNSGKIDSRLEKRLKQYFLAD